LKLNKKNKNKLVWKHVKVNRKNKIRVRMSKEESNQRALDKMSQELSQLLENVTEKREKEKLGRELVKFY
jgi:mevalonate kinase